MSTETQKFRFDVVFEKLTELTRENEHESSQPTSGSSAELDEIEELRRFAAEIQDPEPPSFTTT